MENEQISIMLAQHDQLIRGLERRMEDVEETQKSLSNLTISTKELALSVKNMTEVQKDQGLRIKALEMKPAKMWESITGTIITGIVGAILGAIIAVIAG